MNWVPYTNMKFLMYIYKKIHSKFFKLYIMTDSQFASLFSLNLNIKGVDVLLLI